MLLDDNVETGISDLIPLAPLHQPQSLRLIRAIRQLRPNIQQSVSFDTAFHQTNSDLVRRFAIPRALHDDGIKRYGFHGLSYQFIAGQLLKIAPDIAAKKVIVAHLGSGASLCGLDDGKSRDTSMSFTALDGIPMATRSGAIDPGVLLHLLTQKHYSATRLETLLYHQSGLLGVSGLSADSRDLVASGVPEAVEALDLFALRIAGETARIANTLDGLDAFVFTAGIGEHQPEIRARISSQLAWLGIDLDHGANRVNEGIISSSQSRVKVLVIATDEEQVIANEAVALLGFNL
jgi:acetate kinase